VPEALTTEIEYFRRDGSKPAITTEMRDCRRHCRRPSVVQDVAQQTRWQLKISGALKEPSRALTQESGSGGVLPRPLLPDVVRSRVEAAQARMEGAPPAGRLPRVEGRRLAGGVDHQQWQDACACLDGHFTEPNEQNTQQSPGFGRNTA
jgi:hypothetical protein